MQPNNDYHLAVIIGDLHGNMQAFKLLLDKLNEKYGIFTDRNELILRRGVKLIQTGDRIDRDEHSKLVVEACMMLDKANNGNSAQLFGNHELLALANLDLAKALVGNPNPEEGYQWSTHGYNGGLKFVLEFGTTPQEAFRNYCESMKAEGKMGRWFRGLKPFDITRIGDKKVLSVHGGIPKAIDSPLGLLEYLSNFGDSMRGRTELYPGGSQAKYLDNPLLGEHSLFWDRNIPAGSLGEAEKLLDSLEIDYLVIGHTPQSDGKIGRYGKRIFNDDIGMAQRYGGHDPAAVVITEQGVKAFYASSGEEEPEKRKGKSFFG